MAAYDVELSAPPRLPPATKIRARILVRVHGVPVAQCVVTQCVVDVPPDGLGPAQLTARLKKIVGSAAKPKPEDAARAVRGREPAEHGPHMTVQIATQDRAPSLRRCLPSPAGCTYRSFDVLVIDNAPPTEEARAVVRAFEQAHPEVAVRYRYEPVAGAARAHNRGLQVAEDGWVVRTDNDVVVDEQRVAAVFDVLARGGGVVYQPGALAWHGNRRDYASLHRLMHDHGVGLTAYPTAAALRRPGPALGLARHPVLGVRHMLGRCSSNNSANSRDYPRELERRELRGMFAGPAAYLARRQQGRADGA